MLHPKLESTTKLVLEKSLKEVNAHLGGELGASLLLEAGQDAALVPTLTGMIFFIFPE